MSIKKLFAQYLKYSVGIMPRKLKFYLPKNYEAKKVNQKNPERQLIISVPFEVYESTPTASFTSLKQRIAGQLSLANGIVCSMQLKRYNAACACIFRLERCIFYT